MRVSSPFVAGCLLVSAFTGTAAAAPVDDFISRLEAWLEPAMISLDVAMPAGKSKAAALPTTTATLSMSGMNIALGDSVAIDTIATEGDDILVANTVTIKGLDLKEDGVRLLADGVTLQRVALPPPGTDNAYLRAQMVGALRLENVLMQSGQNIIQADQISLGFGGRVGIVEPAPERLQLSLYLQGLVLNQSILQSMDLNDLPGLMPILAEAKIDLRFAASWTVNSGDLDVSPAQLYVPGLGTYELAVQLGGATEPLLSSLGAAFVAMADGGEMDMAAQQALGIQLLSQLSFKIGTVKLVDGGMVDVAAKGVEAETGKGREDFKLMLVDGLDDGLGALEVSDAFVETAITAVAAFIDQGGTLGFDADPAMPVTLLELVALAQSPNLLVDRLKLTPVHLP